MGKINWARVILGGLAAGIVYNVIEGISGALTMEEVTAAMEAHTLSMNQTPAMMMIYLGLGFLFGILGVWIYAAIRPRFGPGPNTALIAAFVVWLFYFGSIVGWASIGLYSGKLIVTWTIVGLVESVIAILLGAWIYKEREASAATA